MFKVAKESCSTLIRSSLKSLVFSSLTRKFQVCAVRPIYIGMLSKGNIWLQRRTFYRTMSILYVFFRALLLWWKRTKQKEGEREMIRGAVRKMKKKISNKNYGISLWIMFNWPEYGIWSIAEHIWGIFAGRVWFDILQSHAVKR